MNNVPGVGRPAVEPLFARFPVALHPVVKQAPGDSEIPARLAHISGDVLIVLDPAQAHPHFARVRVRRPLFFHGRTPSVSRIYTRKCPQG